LVNVIVAFVLGIIVGGLAAKVYESLPKDKK